MKVTIMPENITVDANAGETLSTVLQKAGAAIDMPCGGNGLCGKCKVEVTKDGITKEALACQTPVTCDMAVRVRGMLRHNILTEGKIFRPLNPDKAKGLAMAFDIGTTTIVGYLLDAGSGASLAVVSGLNPQREYGADVISRIQYALGGGANELKNSVRAALDALILSAAKKAGADAGDIKTISIVGNTCMHHLFLGIGCAPLVSPPYMPENRAALSIPSAGILKSAPNASLRILPLLAGYVGADTAGCLLSLDFGNITPLTLLIDVGTNGEMVLGNKEHRVCCSTAAGPAFEGAKITCGMRGAKGAIDHIFLNNEGQIGYTVIGGGKPVGICGSGLLDAAAVLLETGLLRPDGRICRPDEIKTGLSRQNAGMLTQYEGKPAVLFSGAIEGGVFLTQKDIRELQLAKAAIRAGVELLAKKSGVMISDIRRVFLAGAFGSYLRPKSACAIGMIPHVLLDRITPVGNAAGEGAKLAALSKADYVKASRLAENTDFLELASMQEFQDCFIDSLSFAEGEAGY